MTWSFIELSYSSYNCCTLFYCSSIIVVHCSVCTLAVYPLMFIKTFIITYYIQQRLVLMKASKNPPTSQNVLASKTAIIVLNVSLFRFHEYNGFWHLSVSSARDNQTISELNNVLRLFLKLIRTAVARVHA